MKNGRRYLMVVSGPCSFVTNSTEERHSRCLCTRGSGPTDTNATERISTETTTTCTCTTERMSVYCQYFATTSTSANTKMTCMSSKDAGSPDVSIQGVAVCCRWSAGKSTEKNETYCECECPRGYPGISIIGSPPSPPIISSDGSNDEQQVDKANCTPANCPLPKDSSSNSSTAGPSTLVCGNTNSPQDQTEPGTSPTSSGLNAQQSCLVKTSPRSCLKIERSQPTYKSVKIQMPEPRDRKNQGCLTDGGRCNMDCIYNREKKQMSTNTSFSQAMRNVIDRASSVIFKDSSGACSLMDSATGSCEANAQASYYHNKLISTLQILQNREETIRVQAESLSVAEDRISVLTERATELRRELERKSKELNALRETLETCKAVKVDVSVSARGDTDVENQSDVVSTLQSNLTIIEDLYRECFYEAAKQEDLIDMLRNSYLDVRLIEKQKTDQIGRMQNVINSQKMSLDKCQDIALEVDTLKLEISNFMSSSTPTNNDSGMWERSEESLASAPDVHEDLQDITAQLLRLQEILTDPCACGLQIEIKRLKQKNAVLEKQTNELWHRNCEVEKMLQATDEAKKSLELKYKEDINVRDEQLNELRIELASVVESAREQTTMCDQMKTQLRQTEELLGNKSEELVRIQQQCDTQQETIEELSKDAKRANELYKENCKLSVEVSSLSSQLSQWRSQLADSNRCVRKLEAKLRHALQACSEKENNATELQSQLEQAHARGAALCGDARHVLCSIRHWARRMKESKRELGNLMKEKDDLIASLQERLQNRSGSSMQCLCDNAELPCASSTRQASCSRLEARRQQFLATSENEIASCSRAPIPPRRLFRKKLPYGFGLCKGSRWFCDESQQLPERQDACQNASETYFEEAESAAPSAMGNVSPTDELFRRMESLSDALADGCRRWTKSDGR